MKRILTIFLVFFTFIAVNGQTIQDIIKNKPNPPRLVNDYAHVLTADQIQHLEQKLVQYDDSTSTQIVVITVKTLNDYPIEDAGLAIIRGWAVGNKKTNNGIIILAAIDDRKIRIETGYGLEGAIPDITANQIIEQYIVDNFREQNYYRGFDQASTALIKAAAGEYTAPEGYRDRGQDKFSGRSIFKTIIIIIVIIILISRGGGSRGGGLMSRRGYRRGISPIWWLPLGGSGGSWGGGGGGWSGGGGGGFGGFGGGSGGGGGASGSW
ncbi:MAG TPA: TPM domain-containing protein [Chitinophagaceae bacterium]|nr:TPM domain-containing protein [Chitinophagaceae bacterium]